MNAQERIKITIGEMVFQNCILTEQMEGAVARIKDLETKLAAAEKYLPRSMRKKKSDPQDGAAMAGARFAAPRAS